MYVVTVEFDIKAEKLDEFRAQMVANARASREREPGCLQFDVCADPAKPERIFLYEVYAHRAAFDAHLAADHFKAFDKTVAPWIAAKAIRTYTRLDPQ
ncbi:MAG: putative quinol monooxygenase [Betaproteobacteria bacterium]